MKQRKLYPVEPLHDLREMLIASADRYGTRSAFCRKVGGEYKKISYRQFYHDVRALGAAL